MKIKVPGSPADGNTGMGLLQGASNIRLGTSMKQLGNLIERIIERANINLREQGFDMGPYIRQTIPLNQLVKFYAFCGITSQHAQKEQDISFNIIHPYSKGPRRGFYPTIDIHP